MVCVNSMSYKELRNKLILITLRIIMLCDIIHSVLKLPKVGVGPSFLTVSV